MNNNMDGEMFPGVPRKIQETNSSLLHNPPLAIMYGTATGPQTGVSTPRSSSSLRPLVLSHGSLEHSFLIPTNIHFQASQIKDRFLASLPEPTDELAQDDEPSSVAELVARYLGFVAQDVNEGEDDAQGSYEEVLKLVLNEFERGFLRGNEVHALVATLPGIDTKKLKVVESYYAARAASNRPIRPHESALFRAASDEEAKIYNVFGGQGNIEEYFDELSGFVQHIRGLCGGLNHRICGTLAECCLAAATAAADSWESFEKVAVSALTVLFWIGSRSQQTFPRTSLAPTILQDSLDHGEGTPTPMLSIRDLSQAQVQEHISATNKYLPEDRQIAISLINSARNMVVAGPPISLYGLNLQLRKVKAPTGLDQTRIPFTERKFQWEKATVFPNATHVLDFGPGGVSGLGVLTSRNKDGTGVRVILAGTVNGTVPEVGYKPELFDRDEEHAVKYAVDWVKEHGPKLVKTSSGQTFVDTKDESNLGSAACHGCWHDPMYCSLDVLWLQP
ncbi:hypothetical protein DID88_000067 [Monilinia fructigena]|uniref:Uncharacterized protein n=1 Tax=Monilinia fructigena TaxID=38457 RepID=A0A395IPK7_9HELO|nr:hypothetical protein DID88_000067 [Monilinia fructigena]